MNDIQRLQQVLPGNIQIGFVERVTEGDGVFILVRGSWEAPIRDLHNIIFDAVIRCFNLFTHIVEDRWCWRVGGAFEVSIELVGSEPVKLGFGDED